MATGRDGCAGATDAHALAGDHRCRTGEEARTLARTMVERRLAADVQIGTS